MNKKKKIKEVPTAEGYNRWAANYESNANPLMALDEMKFVENIDPIVKGEKIVDLGCGTGRFTIWLSRSGAEVTGVDFSEEMLKIAKGKSNNNIEYILHDLSKPFPFKTSSFDKVISTLVLEHIADLRLFFKEIKRICSRSGMIYISAMHPAMMLKGNQANFTDPVTGDEIRPKGYPNQIADFVVNINKAGLLIEDMKEYVCTKEFADKFPKAVKYLNWPILLSFKLKTT